ncbi:MAG: GntR family transcriptional regulator [Paracoccaceae bacterium]
MAEKKSSVDKAYVQLRKMAVNFEFKPEERLNESALSARFGASRTPLREALNRLVAEGLLTFKHGSGFYCRALNPTRVLELYEARSAIETEVVIRAVERASDAEVQSVVAYIDDTEHTYDTTSDLSQLLEMDEEFHIRLAELANNAELLRILKNLNGRIRYVRLINLKILYAENQTVFDEGAKLSAHRKIIEAIVRRDTDAAVAALRNHIERRREETTEAVRIAYSELYVPDY